MMSYRHLIHVRCKPTNQEHFSMNMNRTALLALSLASVTFAAVSSASAATVLLNPTADTFVNNASVNQNNGTATTFIANNNGGAAASGVRLSFLRFDLSSIDTSTISNINLGLTVTAAAAKGYNIYGLVGAANESWGETTMTWNNAPAVVSSVTTKPSTLAAYLDTADLYNSGAVLASFTSRSSVGLETILNVSSGSVFDFINADADKIVTFVIAKQDADTSTSGTAWSSREAASGKPLLTISTVPEPSSVLLGGLGLLALLRRRRA